MKLTIAIDIKKCAVCGDCLDHCPQKILELQDISKKEKKNMGFFRRMDALYHKNKKLVVTHEKCLGCGLCIPPCRHSALSLEPVEKSAPLPTAVSPSTHQSNIRP